MGAANVLRLRKFKVGRSRVGGSYNINRIQPTEGVEYSKIGINFRIQ